VAPSLVQFLIDNWVLVLAAAVSGGLLVAPLLRGGSGGSGAIGTAEAVRLINREKGVLVDVGEPAEYAASHASGARNVPFGSLDGATSGGKGLPTNKALPIVVLCPTGARAGRAAGLLRKAGYEKAVALAGGTRAWREASLPVEKSAAAESA
jgi:rhodanese-related sulfurtransferase